MANPKPTLREKLIGRYVALCEKSTKSTLIIDRKDLKELFGDSPDDMAAILHHTDGGGDLFARVSREYLLDRLQKLSEPAVVAEKPKPLNAVPNSQPFVPPKPTIET